MTAPALRVAGRPSSDGYVPTEYRADLVLLLEGAADANTAAAVVVEAQLGRGPDKRWSWPVYLTSLRARLRCDVALLIVTSDAAVAGWAAVERRTAELRIRIRATGLTTYPDVSVVCGKAEADSEDPHAIVNPTLVVEVLSDSTEAYDRGGKAAHYRHLPSLRSAKGTWV